MKLIPSKNCRLFLTAGFVLAVVGLPPAPARAAQPPAQNWSVTVLDRLLAATPPGQQFVQISDMEISVAYLQAWRDHLASGPQPNVAFGGTFTPWPGGNVYYAFDASVTAADQQAFLGAAADWATFANLHFIARTTQANFLLVTNNASLGGGNSFVGMVGGAQLFQIGPNSWNRGTLCHELGHALGLVHEHQRSDRDSYVTIATNNILAGHLADFVLLTDSQNKSPYDFLSVMHYARNAFSVDPASNTIVPLPACAQYLNVMGHGDPVLSAADRAGMALVYGPGPGATNAVTNTQDSGPGSLRSAMYYAFDHPGTTITFNIPTSDAGFSNQVFNILPTDGLPGIFNGTTIDGGSEPTNSNADGPEILLNGALCHTASVYPNGLTFRGTNSAARGLVINNFPNCGVLLDGANTVGNTVSGCYLGIDATGAFAVTNGLYPVEISGGAVSNTIGGTTAAARNVISGGVYQGVFITGTGTWQNTVAGNFIGLNAGGTGALPNGFEGVGIYNGAQSNLIGGASAAARNVISGNAYQGVVIQGGGTSGNVVAGNYIGVNPAGGAALGNGGAGVIVESGADGNVIAGNVISGNQAQGIYVSDAGTSGNQIQNNFIGLNAAGSAAVSNTWAGVEISGGAAANVIGPGNVISGNGNDGVMIAYAGTTANQVAGNFIGLNAAGVAAVPNAWRGVDLYGGATGNVVGGLGAARNFISGNGSDGILIAFGSGLNVVQGNTIGLDAANSTPVPNIGNGVLIYSGASSNLIGGVTLGAANLIAGNSSVGVFVTAAATNNTIRGNSVFNNASGYAIYLNSGGNNEIAAPTLASAVVTTNTIVSGSYSGVSGVNYTLDFYADAPPAGGAEAQTHLGSASYAGTGGAAGFAVPLGARLPAGRAVTATITDPAGNTSMLSTGVAATMTSTPNDGIPDAWRALYFGGSGTTTNSQSAAWSDPDDDGMSNYQEFLAGINPTNAASVFKLVALNPNLSANAVRLQSAAGTVYRVEYRDDLTAGGWSILADQILGTGANMFLADPAAGSLPKRFYRAQVLW